MKRVRCPKCDNFITFDETKYEAGQSLVFVCPNCNKQFGIRMGVSKLRETRKEEQIDENANENGVGSIVVIENVFAYKQVIPLQMGDNVIGQKLRTASKDGDCQQHGCSNHSGRHSFASLITLEAGVPMETICVVLHIGLIPWDTDWTSRTSSNPYSLLIHR